MSESTKKHILIWMIGIAATLAILGLLDDNRQKIEDINNCVIVKQHCGFDNLDGGYYQVKDLTTGKVRRVNVDIRDCDVYKEGYTIKTK